MKEKDRKILLYAMAVFERLSRPKDCAGSRPGLDLKSVRDELNMTHEEVMTEALALVLKLD